MDEKIRDGDDEKIGDRDERGLFIGKKEKENQAADLALSFDTPGLLCFKFIIEG